MAFIRAAVEVDPLTLTDEKIALLQERIPGLSVPFGSPLYSMLEAQSNVDSENRQYLTDVPTEIFQTEGETLFRVPVQAATQAAGAATVTSVDTNGPYVLPAGTQITLAGPGDERIGFATVNEVTIPNGLSSTAAGEVLLIAITPGAAGTGLQAGPQFEETFDWVATLTLTGQTIGGADGETEAEYRSRLSDRLQLLGDTLTRPIDYEIEARTVSPEVARALAIDLYQPAVNELQQINVANATGGTTTWTFETQTTGTIAHNAVAAVVQAALEALSNIAPGDVIVTGGPLNTAPMFVEFTGALAGANRTQMTIGVNSLTGGSATIAFSTLRQGAAAVPNTAGTSSLATIDDAGLDPGSTVRAVGQARQRALSASGLLVTWITPTYTAITVVFAGKCDPDFDPADVEARTEQAVLDFLSPARWGVPARGAEPLWLLKPTVFFQDISAVINGVDGFDRWTTLTVNGGTADVALSGVAPLPSPTPATTASGTVTAP